MNLKKIISSFLLTIVGLSASDLHKQQIYKNIDSNTKDDFILINDNIEKNTLGNDVINTNSYTVKNQNFKNKESLRITIETLETLIETQNINNNIETINKLISNISNDINYLYKNNKISIEEKNNFSNKLKEIKITYKNKLGIEENSNQQSTPKMY